MLLQLQRYNIVLLHLPGKSIHIADTLSRKFLSDTYPKLAEGMNLHVHTVLASLPVSDKKKLEDIKSVANNEPRILTLQNVILSGWPESRKECPLSIIDYWNQRDELTIIHDLILKGSTIVIPKDLRSEMLLRIHSGRMDIEKRLNRARDIMFWPNMSTGIASMGLSCPYA